MSQSGSYYYPVMQKPVSSLGGGKLELVTNVPEPDAYPGRTQIYFDNSNSILKLKEEDGDVVEFPSYSPFAASGATYSLSGTDRVNIDLSVFRNITVDFFAASASVGLTMSNPVDGKSYLIKTKQGENDSKFHFQSNVKFSNGITSSFSTGSNAYDFTQFIYDGSGSVFWATQVGVNFF